MKRRVVTSPFVVRRSSFVVGRLIECWKTDCTSVAPPLTRWDGRTSAKSLGGAHAAGTVKMALATRGDGWWWVKRDRKVVGVETCTSRRR